MYAIFKLFILFASTNVINTFGLLERVDKQQFALSDRKLTNHVDK